MKDKSHISTDNTIPDPDCFTKSFPCEVHRTDTMLTTGQKKKVWIESYGCTASKADSEMIAGLLKTYGYELARNEKESSVNLIVTCSVKDATEHKMLYRIGDLTKSKKPTVIAGCLPRAERHRIEHLFPSASLLGPNSIDRTVDVVNSALSHKKMVILEDSTYNKTNIPRVRLNPVVGIVEIANGCMSECTFCQTKLAKGRVRSYPAGEILRQIQHDTKEGCKEIWLTSTDNGCYGKDFGSNIAELLRLCCTIDSDYKIRVGMMNPMHLASIMEDLVEVYYENDKIFKFLHIPVQSGSDTVLRKMNRGHSAKTYRDVVKLFRSRIPEITIATDIIVGFPSETDSDFEQTMQLIRDSQPDIINLSKYSARANTAAAKLKQLEPNIIKRRSDKLHVISRDISRKMNSRWIGWKGEVIIDEINNNDIVARNYAYKSVVVSPTLGLGSISGGVDKKYSLGTKVNVEVYGCSEYSLKAISVN